MLSVIMLSVIMLSVIMLSVIMLNVVILNVVAPWKVLRGTNTLAYWSDLKVTKKMNCCDFCQSRSAPTPTGRSAIRRRTPATA